ncbi:MAG: hypothetical protein IPO21_16520 [Bacteroidales bacterium]|nr:hypothetical protein [Bacteroidales bacterium]
MTTIPFIEPNLRYFSSIDKIDEHTNFYDELNWNFNDFLSNKFKYLYVVGEPGNGKSRLMQEIAIKRNKTLYIDIKRLQGMSIPDYFNNKRKYIFKEEVQSESISKNGFYFKDGFSLENSEDVLICLDAIDEISSEHLSVFREHLQQLQIDYNKCSIILSGRTHNIKNLQDILPDKWEVVLVEKFQLFQVRDILKQQIDGIADSRINELLTSTSKDSFNPFVFHENILQTPRYLMLTLDLLKAKENKHIEKLSQYELFELFIKQKLRKDNEKLKEKIDTSFLFKFLGLLALIMDIKQTNEITKNDFTIILDDVQSDLKQFIFNKITPDDFFDLLF